MLCIFEEFGYGRKDEGDSDSDSLILFDECCLYEQQASSSEQKSSFGWILIQQ